MKNEESVEHYISIEVSKFFSQERAKHNFNYSDVAEKIGIPRGTYHGYESGKRSMPLGVFKKLCNLYGLDAEKTFNKIMSNTTKAINRINGQH